MTQQRLSLSSMIAAAAAVAALGLPGDGFGGIRASRQQRTGRHRSSRTLKSEKTREQVIAETKAAMQQGRLFYGEASNYPLPVPDAGSGKTRKSSTNCWVSRPPSAMRVCAFTPG